VQLNRRRELDVLSISALDIFASALGVFILVAIILFPYYLKQPSIEAAEAGAAAELAAAERAWVEAEGEAEAAEARLGAAMAALKEAKARLEAAEVSAAEAAPVAPEPERGERPAPLTIDDLDLVFVMDTTGSMRRELEDLQANLVGIIRVLNRLAASLRVGFVAYRDRGEAYVTLQNPLEAMNAANLNQMVGFVGRLGASGGGDDPEAVDEALRQALAMPWRSNAEGRIIVIGDAPVHPHRQAATIEMAAAFAGSAPDPTHPRSVSAIFTGRSPNARAFFERLAEAGHGEVSEHQEFMIESILLSILPEPGSVAAR
jgi:hypothetical protein